MNLLSNNFKMTTNININFKNSISRKRCKPIVFSRRILKHLMTNVSREILTCFTNDLKQHKDSAWKQSFLQCFKKTAHKHEFMFSYIFFIQTKLWGLKPNNIFKNKKLKQHFSYKKLH